MAQKRRRRRRKQKKITQWFKKLSMKQKVLLISGIVVLLLMIAGVIYVASIFNKLDTQELGEDDIFINDDLPDTVGVGYTNFVLFGGDSRDGEVNKNLNTDTIIIVSLNNETKEVKMVSVYRDTLLDIANGKIKKCNSAYNIGGAKQAINMLNMNLDLDIKKYVTVDFSAVVDLVDMVGGIEVEVSKAEMKEMNKFIGETASVSGKKANYIKSPGLQKLDGVQATTYSRIRKNVGNDYARTERQRLVIQKVVEKAMKSNLSTINKIIDELFPRISTNFTMTEILSYAKDFKKYTFGETSGFPFKKGSGKIPGKGDSVFPITLESNVSELHAFLFGTEDYQPSSKVVSISGEIAYIVGNRKPDKDTTSTGNNNTDTSEEPDNEEPGDGTGTEDETGNEGTGNEGTGNEGTGNEGTGNEGTGNEGTGNEGTGNEGTGNEGTGNEGTGNEGTGNEGTGNEGTGNEGTGNEGTGSEGTQPTTPTTPGTPDDGSGQGNSGEITTP